MSTIDDIEADEAALKTAVNNLINLAGEMLAELQRLAANPALPAAVQAKIDALHSKFTTDIATVTTAVSADGSAIPPISPAPTSAPTITGVEPASGAPGDAVVITGVAFTGATGVDFGSAPVANTDFHVISDTEIDTTVPVGGSGRVMVTTSGGVSNAGTFTYATAVPAPAP